LFFICETGCWNQDTGKKVAIKKIKDAFIDLVDAKRILREMKLLRHLQHHENIINVVDVMTVPQGSRLFEDIYIVTDLFESGFICSFITFLFGLNHSLLIWGLNCNRSKSNCEISPISHRPALSVLCLSDIEVMIVVDLCVWDEMRMFEKSLETFINWLK